MIYKAVMGWQYAITTRELSLNGEFEGTGYSGREGWWRDNPAAISIKDYGPIPIGIYKIGKDYYDPVRGPCVMALTPSPEDEMFGREGFLIHGDNINHDASSGCIILDFAIREKIAFSGDDELTVIA